MTTDTKKAAPVQRDGQAPAKPEGKQMQNKDSVLDRLLAELKAVTKYFSVDYSIGVIDGWSVSAYLSEGHRSEDTRHSEHGVSNPFTVIRSDDRASATLELAIEDVLERIALAAPQQVPA